MSYAETPERYAGSGALIGAFQAQAQVQAGTPTLARAMEMLDDLNKRLHVLSGHTTEIAQVIGGPYPTNGQNIKATEKIAQSGVARLNESVNEAHGTVTVIEGALAALRRALGS